MSTFTITLSEALEFKPDNVSRETYFGLATYPIFDDDYREQLNDKIVDHYYNREIGVETLSMFELAMRRRMNEIMPLYNQLYLSERRTFDPFKTVDIKTLGTGTATQDTTGNSGNTTGTDTVTKSRGVTSEFPQTSLENNEDYATSAADSNATAGSNTTSDSTSASQSDSSQNTESETSGYQGLPSAMLAAWRETMLNIDLMIITELADLFMGLWDNNDEVLPPGFPVRGYYL